MKIGVFYSIILYIDLIFKFIKRNLCKSVKSALSAFKKKLKPIHDS